MGDKTSMIVDLPAFPFDNFNKALVQLFSEEWLNQRGGRQLPQFEACQKDLWESKLHKYPAQ